MSGTGESDCFGDALARAHEEIQSRLARAEQEVAALKQQAQVMTALKDIRPDGRYGNYLVSQIVDSRVPDNTAELFNGFESYIQRLTSLTALLGLDAVPDEKVLGLIHIKEFDDVWQQVVKSRTRTLEARAALVQAHAEVRDAVEKLVAYLMSETPESAASKKTEQELEDDDRGLRTIS